MRIIIPLKETGVSLLSVRALSGCGLTSATRNAIDGPVHICFSITTTVRTHTLALPWPLPSMNWSWFRYSLRKGYTLPSEESHPSNERARSIGVKCIYSSFESSICRSRSCSPTFPQPGKVQEGCFYRHNYKLSSRSTHSEDGKASHQMLSVRY